MRSKVEMLFHSKRRNVKDFHFQHFYQDEIFNFKLLNSHQLSFISCTIFIERELYFEV